MGPRGRCACLLVIVLLCSCHSGEPPSGLDGLGTTFGLEYTVSGGFVGGVHRAMTIDSNGSVTLSTYDPPIRGSLTSAEQTQLSSFADFFWVQPDTLRGGCMDDFTYVIAWTGTRGTKVVSVDGCVLMHISGPRYPILEGVVALLDTIAARVHREGTAWRGV